MTAQGGDSNQGPSALAEIGRQLAARREGLGRTIADAERELKIRKVYLEALESGSTRFPLGLVYRVGFLRAYAEYLGLDGAELAAAYRRALEPPEAPQQPRRAAPEPEPDHEPPEEPLPALAERMRRAGRGMSAPAGRGRRSGAWVAIALVLVLALVGSYVFRIWPFEAGPLPPEDQTPPSVSDPGDVEPPGTGTPPGEEPPGPSSGEFTLEHVQVLVDSPGELRLEVDAEELQVELTFADRVWLRAAADGQVVSEGLMEAGSTIELEAHELLELRIGRASQTTVHVHGVEIGPAGTSDDARTVVLVRAP